MDAVLGSLIAVVGTLLGSVATYVFQRRGVEIAENRAQRELRRRERLEVFAEFAGAAMDLRRAAYDRWHRERDSPASDAFILARDEYYKIYAAARNFELRLRLVADDQELAELAHEAIERAGDIKDSASEGERATAGDLAKQALDKYMRAASARLR
ncbi:hypothetical protein [Streptomyces sp. NPDC001978]|uniref:hypothetical protein n=1 Tax=Streptomyces sp. NPDC001978 TaxID=3364627 RepID=UPI0036CCFC83